MSGENGIPSQGVRSASLTGRTKRLGRRTRGVPDAGRIDGADVLGSPGASPGRPGCAGRTAPVRDPWEESDGSGSGHDVPGGNGRDDSDPSHDPHEVTVQLDGIGQQLEDMLVRQVKGADGSGDGQDASDGPVFVDESGRRSRLYRRIGIAVGLACAVYAVVIVITLLSGNSNAPWLPVPGQDAGKPAGEVESTTPPTDSAPRGGTVGSSPGSTTPTAGQGTATAETPGATASGATAGPAKPGSSASPKTSPTGTATAPGAGPTVPTPTPTTTPSATGPATPTPSDPGTTPTPTPTPTVTTGTGESPAPGPGPVANGPSDPSPIATEPATADPAPPAPTSSTVPVA
ncbi:hypothetical protein AB0H86_28425 [Streptomyces sp. NPDC050997]|uniref:hypothetical protein n=1 Tax=Streptomyces sp. NPDC050997 TaxID=3155519 RepID=UPI0034262068